MFTSLKSSIMGYTNAACQKAVNLYGQVKEVVWALPQSFKKIKEDNKIQDVFNNALTLNVVKFALPLTLLHYGKRYCLEIIGSELALGSEVVEWADSAVDATLMAVLLLRWRLKVLGINSFLTFVAPIEMEDAFREQDQKNQLLLCHECSVKDRFLSQIALQTHFLVGGLSVFGANLILERLIGSWGSFLLSAYWNGFLSYQYHLASVDVCGEHQVEILTRNKARCLALGGVTGLMAKIPQTLLKLAGFSIGLPWQIALVNLTSLFTILHARTMGLPVVRQDLEQTPFEYDPILLSWEANFFIVKKLVNHIKREIKLGAKKETTIISFLEQWLPYYEKLTSYKLIQLFVLLCIVPEFTSLERFVKHPNVSVYSHDLVSQAETYLCLFKALGKNKGFKATRYLLRTPYVGPAIKKVGMWYFHSSRGMPKEFYELAVMVGREPHLLDKIQALIDYSQQIKPQTSQALSSFWQPASPQSPSQAPLLIEDYEPPEFETKLYYGEINFIPNYIPRP